MIYLIYGTDKEKARAKARQLVDSLVAKKPDASVGRYDAESFKPELLDELIGGQGLFVSRLIVELNNLFANEETKAALLKNLDRLAESENIFIILETKVLKAELTKFEKYAEKIQEFSHAKEGGGVFPKRAMAGGSPFALADAFGQRDKKSLWTLFLEQRISGSAAEELHGLLFWQLKSMLLARASKTADEAGLKPFVYSKAKQFAGNYTPEELSAFSGRMVSIYHDAHRGEGELSLFLEQLILEL